MDLLESNTNKIHHLSKRQTSNRAITLANQLSGARGAPVSSGGGASYGRKRRQISSSIALANQLSGAKGAPVSRGGSSYGRRRRSPGEFVVDDVRDDWKFMWNWLLIKTLFSKFKKLFLYKTNR